MRILLGEKLEKNKRLKGLEFSDNKKLIQDCDTVTAVLKPPLLSTNVFLVTSGMYFAVYKPHCCYNNQVITKVQLKGISV